MSQMEEAEEGGGWWQTARARHRETRRDSSNPDTNSDTDKQAGCCPQTSASREYSGRSLNTHLVPQPPPAPRMD